jgi:hypothetical protein
VVEAGLISVEGMATLLAVEAVVELWGPVK